MEIIINNESKEKIFNTCKLKKDLKEKEIEFEIIYSKLDIDFLPTCINDIIQKYYNDLCSVYEISISNYYNDITIIYFTDEYDNYYNMHITKRSIPMINAYIKFSDVVRALYECVDIDHYFEVMYDPLNVINMFMIDKYSKFNFINYYSYDNAIEKIDKYKYKTYSFRCNDEIIQNVKITDEILFEMMANIVKQMILICT